MMNKFIFAGAWNLIDMTIVLNLSCNAGPPTCQSLEFLGSMIEGQRVSFIASYSGGWDIWFTTFYIW